MVLGRVLPYFMTITLSMFPSGDAWSSPFHCYPINRSFEQKPPQRLHGSDARTRTYTEDLLWSVNNNRMKAAGHFDLAQIGCGAGCILLAAVDDRTGFVKWMPKTISNWPIHMQQPVMYRPDSRLVVVLGQLDELGPDGPFYYLLGAGGFRPLSPDELGRCAASREGSN